MKNSHASDQVKDEGNGIYTATLTGTTAGETSIEVIVNGAVLQIKNSAKVTLTADKKHPSKDKSKLEADPTTIVADGNTSSTIKLTLLDVNDNPLAGQKVKFNSSLKNSHVSDEVKDEGNGIYTATLTGTTAGETSIEVTVNEVVLPVKDAAKVTLTADSSNPSLDKSKLTTEPITIVADGKDSATLKLTLIDIKDNPITGYPDKVVFSTEPADSKIKLEAVTEQDPGVYSAKLTGTQAGDISITAKFNGLELKLAPVTVTLKADSKNPSVDKSKLVAEPTTIVADDKQTSTLKLTLMDANDNPIEGQVVKFEPSLANSQFDEVKENDKGVYTAKLKGKTAGVNTIKVKVNDKEFAIKTNVTLIADSNTVVLKQVTLDGDNTSKVANGNDNFTFTAVVKDANDNPVPEITLKWQYNAGNKVTLSDKGESKTDSEGKAKITLTSTTNTVTEVQVSAKTGDDEAVDANKKVNFLRKFNLNGVVADATTNKPIEGAEVGLYTSDSDSKPKYKVTS
ncbi:invasin domain 3-containing protein [Arsenophonus endosymbiont of Crataerina pallida]|uniref:invasin domain 3-containing protein n=1 Tax=Arsenophonus endosymbiont of Crataerina pallida TaxID=3066235 RepID=UPI0030CB084D